MPAISIDLVPGSFPVSGLPCLDSVPIFQQDTRRGVPHMIDTWQHLLVLGSRLHWQAVHCGASLCQDMDSGFSGTRHSVLNISQ